MLFDLLQPSKVGLFRLDGAVPLVTDYPVLTEPTCKVPPSYSANIFVCNVNDHLTEQTRTNMSKGFLTVWNYFLSLQLSWLKKKKSVLQSYCLDSLQIPGQALASPGLHSENKLHPKLSKKSLLQSLNIYVFFISSWKDIQILKCIQTTLTI